MMKCVTLARNLGLTPTDPNPNKTRKKYHELSAGPQMTVTRTQAPVALAPSAASEGLLETDLLFFAFVVLKLGYYMQVFVVHTVICSAVRRTAQAQSAFKVEQRLRKVNIKENGPYQRLSACNGLRQSVCQKLHLLHRGHALAWHCFVQLSLRKGWKIVC